MAAAAGVNILKTGKCPRNTCVVPDGEDVCADGEYCALQEELCDLETTRLSGICKAKPTTCQMNIDPVCGCDGRWGIDRNRFACLVWYRLTNSFQAPTITHVLLRRLASILYRVDDAKTSTPPKTSASFPSEISEEMVSFVPFQQRTVSFR